LSKGSTSHPTHNR